MHADADGADGRTLTGSEIEQVVHELGIPRGLVARAVAELSVARERTRPVWWLGGKTDLMFEHVLEGTLDEAELGQMIEVLRRHFGDPGELRVEAGATLWSTKQEGSPNVHLSVVEYQGRTTVRLEERMAGAASGTVGAAMFAGGFGTFMAAVPFKVVLGKALLLMILFPGAALGATLGWLGGRALWKRWGRERELKLARTFSELVAVGERGRSDAETPGPAALAPVPDEPSTSSG